MGTALVRNIIGKDLYPGVLLFPKGEDPEANLKEYPEQIAYAWGASSGESSAKAEKDLTKNITLLKKLNRSMMDRETRIIEVKEEVNKLSK